MKTNIANKMTADKSTSHTVKFSIPENEYSALMEKATAYRLDLGELAHAALGWVLDEDESSMVGRIAECNTIMESGVSPAFIQWAEGSGEKTTRAAGAAAKEVAFTLREEEFSALMEKATAYRLDLGELAHTTLGWVLDEDDSSMVGRIAECDTIRETGMSAGYAAYNQKRESAEAMK